MLDNTVFLVVTFTAVFSTYLLWIFFIVLLVSSLNEINKDSWHYRLYLWLSDVPGGFKTPDNSCTYGLTLASAPLTVLALCFVYVLIVIFCSIRIFCEWVFIPFFTNEIPDYPAKTYFKLLWDSPSFFCCKKRSVTRHPPVVYLLIMFSSSAFMWEIYRFANRVSTPVETLVFLSILILSVLIAGVIWTVKRPKTKEAWASLKGNLCRKLEVVN